MLFFGFQFGHVVSHSDLRYLYTLKAGKLPFPRRQEAEPEYCICKGKQVWGGYALLSFQVLIEPLKTLRVEP